MVGGRPWDGRGPTTGRSGADHGVVGVRPCGGRGPTRTRSATQTYCVYRGPEGPTQGTLKKSSVVTLNPSYRLQDSTSLVSIPPSRQTHCPAITAPALFTL